MKSIELGDYDTFSGLLSLFTAVIGLAYPFILQAIERIQERYITERVSHWFEEETTFARFFFMLKANIPIAIRVCLSTTFLPDGTVQTGGYLQFVY